MATTAEAVPPEEIDRGLRVFSRRSSTHGGAPWAAADVQDDGALAIRLYRATVTSHSILAKDGRPDHRVPVDL